MADTIRMKIADTPPKAPKAPRGVCSVCGEPAYAAQATKCEEHKGQKADETIRITRPGPPPPPVAAPKSKRAAELENAILRDLNPALVQGFAFLCRPIPKENFIAVGPKGEAVVTDLGKQVQFSEWEADILGKAAAEVEKSPIAQSAVAVAGPLLPILYGVAGVAVLAFHGYQLAQTREALVKQYAELTGQTAADKANPAPPPEPENPHAGTSDLPDVASAMTGENAA